MSLRVYNTLTGKKEDFEPLRAGEVRMYVCGPTVYDYFHIGNARAFLVPDVIRRYLEYTGYRVVQVLNFTDIDDKIIKTAQKEGVESLLLAEKYIREFFKDVEALGIKAADYYPRARDHMQEIIDFIARLKEQGYVYESQGDLFFSVRSFDDYGSLSGQDLESLQEGVRIEADDRKRDPLDFVLWKEARPGEPTWESPWGPGRPGWHTECCVMSRQYLGEGFDIHTGGSDLIFPHHENERAQSEAATGTKFVSYWLHNGYINIEGEKMSKSLGNFFTTREVLEEFDPQALRYFLLSKHYRSPINFSREGLQEAVEGLKRIKNFLRSLKEELLRLRLGGEEKVLRAEEEFSYLQERENNFLEAMDDDFNTARAIGHLQELVRSGNRLLNTGLSACPENHALMQSYRKTLIRLAGILGLDLETYAREAEGQQQIGPLVDLLLDLRQKARDSKDWEEADLIRDHLGELGIAVEDGPQGSSWYPVE